MAYKGKKLELIEAQRAELIQGFKYGKYPNYRLRCQMMLLKNEGRSSREIGEILGKSHQSVDAWVKRYKASGIQGLHTKPGRGRKPILDEGDEAQVKKIVKQERQRLRLAKAEIEKETGKSFSVKTLKRFLKNLSADGNVSD